MAANITSLIDSLPNSENQSEVLEDLKTLLGAIHPHELTNLVANISFNAVFDCFASDNREQIELCCDVLRKLLTALASSVVLCHFHDELLTGLSHSSPPVRKLCVSQVERVAREAIDELTGHVDIVKQLVKTLADDSLDIAKLAGDVLFHLGCCLEGLDMLYQGSVLASLQDILAVSDTVRFRLYEALINISRHWLPGLLRTAESGALQQLTNELYRDDILLQLNCLELLSDLAMSEHGLEYLEEQGIVGKVESMMQAVEADPLAGFLIPGLVKFFGCVARVHPKEVCSSKPTFVHIVFDSLSGGEDQTLRNLAVQTVGFIGGTVEGKLALEKLGQKMDKGVQCIGKILRESMSDTKIVVLQALASLLRLEVHDQTSELLKLTERWYGGLGGQPIHYLMSLAEQPFAELRCSTLLVLQAMSLQPWGQVILNNMPGFKEYLVNRSTEQSKEGKEGKYEIVRTLCESPTSTDIFGQPYYVQLRAYQAQGPFYVRVQAQVAMEGDG